MSDQLDNRIDELVALAVLGELTPTEEAELDTALDADSDLAVELDGDLSTAASLQAQLAEGPPPSMKTSVMAAIDALVAADHGSIDAAAVIPLPGTSSLGSAVVPDVVAPLAQPEVVDFAAERTQRRGGFWQPLVAAAAVALLFVGGVLVANRGGDDGSNFEAIATADDAQGRTLAGDLAGTLDVVYSPSQNAFVLVGDGIPTLVDAETYQLWFVDDSGIQSVGLFRPDADGHVEQVFADLDPTDFVVGVTVEPAAGSEAPTLPIIAAT